jgi:ABC-2 type transport system permease protein
MVRRVRTLRITLALFGTVLQRRLAYRGDLLLQGLDELMRGLLALALLQVYAAKTPALAGYTQADLTFVLGFSLTVIALFHCLCGNLYQLSSHYIIQGHLDRVLLRPLPSFLQICCDRLAIEDLSGAVLGIGLMVAAALRIPGFPADPAHLVLLVVMLLSALAVVVAVFMAFAASGFWFEDRVGMVPPVYNLMEFGRWPREIYHPALKLLITVGIPFAFVAILPASLFVGPDRDAPWWQHPGWLTPLVGAAALVAASWVWRAGLRRYNSSGT